MVDELVAAPIEEQIGGGISGKTTKKRPSDQERKPLTITAPPAEFLRVPTIPATRPTTLATPETLPVPTTDDITRLDEELALLLALELV